MTDTSPRPPSALMSAHHVVASHARVSTTGGLLIHDTAIQVHTAGGSPVDRLTEMAALGREITRQAKAHLARIEQAKAVAS